MIDKRVSEDEIIGELADGMVIGVGGWGSRRKPMSLIRAIARSSLKDLTIVSYGGPDVGLLCAAGKVRKVVSGFVSLDSIPLEPFYRQARQNGTIQAAEWDEGMLLLGLQAAGWRVPFLPTRAGLGSDIPRLMPDLQTVTSPYDDGETLLAVPALDLDVALIHMNRADQGGNGQYLGPDPYFDDLFAMAATTCFMTCERLVPTEELAAAARPETIIINRLMTTGVLEVGRGAHFTTCAPDYARDEAFQRVYNAASKSDASWQAFKDRYVDAPTQADYLRAVDELAASSAADSASNGTRPEGAAK
ncbi:MAG: CoA transferase subunit A [Actinobacteria bacterium]|nr:CoA transferase subunit A [Actinomycetota bacterium]MCB9388277.1 CoA transferase subunit A [Acidimicrobiia bacterium]